MHFVHTYFNQLDHGLNILHENQAQTKLHAAVKHPSKYLDYWSNQINTGLIILIVLILISLALEDTISDLLTYLTEAVEIIMAFHIIMASIMYHTSKNEKAVDDKRQAILNDIANHERADGQSTDGKANHHQAATATHRQDHQESQTIQPIMTREQLRQSHM